MKLMIRQIVFFYMLILGANYSMAQPLNSVALRATVRGNVYQIKESVTCSKVTKTNIYEFGDGNQLKAIDWWSLDGGENVKIKLKYDNYGNVVERIAVKKDYEATSVGETSSLGASIDEMPNLINLDFTCRGENKTQYFYKDNIITSKVLKWKYPRDKEYTTVITTFDEKGKRIKEETLDPYGENSTLIYKNGELISRNGVLEELYEKDSEWPKVTKDDQGRTSSVVNSDGSGVWYMYNDQGFISMSKNVNVFGVIIKIYVDYEYDEIGNWISRRIDIINYDKSKQQVICKRNIVYSK